ncbi:MAG: hypothetical protein M4D80_22625 [Myxococcota bacterium]|nr:hypothetical protein [Myxococcota bacterium]
MTRIRLAAIAAIAALSCTVGEEAHQEPDVLDLDSALLVRSRDRLQVCLQIDPALAARTDQLATTLRADLLALRTLHPSWRVAGLDKGEITVVVGCPAGAAVSQRIDEKGIDGAVVGPGLRSAPSLSRTHVHVVTDAVAMTVLGERSFARAIAELAVVDDHRVAEVSTALIVRASAIGTDAFRRDALAQSIGLPVLQP